MSTEADGVAAAVPVVRQDVENDFEQDGSDVDVGNGMDPAENEFVKQGRVFRKPKRMCKTSPRKDEGSVNGAMEVNLKETSAAIAKMQLAHMKNSRRSRAGVRGLPKKGGGGGKGIWGKPGSEMGVTAETQDEHDPNYDSDSQEAYVVQAVKPELDDDQLTTAGQNIMQEYFENGDIEDTLRSFNDLTVRTNRHKFASLAISTALDRHDPHREMTSRLISDMYGTLLSTDEMVNGFDALLADLSDLTIDTPNAPMIVGQFIARAVADDCLPPKFVHSYKGKVDCEHISSALTKADILLGMKHGMVRLDNVWGVGGGNRPVKYLVKRMEMLLKEYLSSGDMDEATRCLKELDVPHFHHELVYQACVMAMEAMSELVTDQVVKLLKSLSTSIILTPDQLYRGVKRIYDDVGDISLDIPAAYMVLDRLGHKMHAEGLLSEQLLRDLPSRGRKRFVSEGDGGRLKNQPMLVPLLHH